MECPNIRFCKFLKKYPQEKDKWYDKYCGDDFMAENCYRFQWCNCHGYISDDINPEGKNILHTKT